MYNKESRKIQVVETPHLFRLQQSIKGLESSESFGREVLVVGRWSRRRCDGVLVVMGGEALQWLDV